MNLTHKYLSLLALAPLFLAIPARAQTASITFDHELKEDGITLDRAGLSPSEVQFGGKALQTWVSRQNSVAADQWARSFRLTIRDPRFKNGRAPSVDVEVQFWHEGNTKVQVLVDAQAGAREASSCWGNKKELQTLKFHLDDAFFGARDFKADAKTLPIDGCDLRINAWASDFHLRSVKISGLNAAAPSDWSRFVSRGGDGAAGTSEHGWVLAPGQSDSITFPIKSTATVAGALRARWEILGANGKVVRTQNQDVTLAPQTETPLHLRFDSAGLAAEEYTIRLSLLQPGLESPVLAFERGLMVASGEDAFILFDRVPIARGMEFEREGMEPIEVEVNGVKRWAWRGSSSRGADGWWHSALFHLTDERFVSGKRPVADVDVAYRHTANAPINISAQLKDGAREVASGWGNNPNWNTLSAGLDQAVWGRPKAGLDPKKGLPDGADLRFNAITGDVIIRSIRVRGFDLDKPDWTRLLRFDGLDAGREMFLFAAGENAELKFKLSNLSNRTFGAGASVQLRDDMGQALWSKALSATIPAHQAAALPVPFSSKGLKQGVYLLGMEMREKIAASAGAAQVLVAANPAKTARTANPANPILLERELNLMVSESAPVPRVRAGEFLYGIDPGGSWRDDWILKWTRFMGGDIVRHTGAESPDDVGLALDVLGKYGLQSAQMFDPPWDADAATRHNREAQVAARAKEIATRYKGRLKFFELGNEPDLTFFYPGPIAAYAEGFTTIASAIKSADPNSVVMNGGLSFAGEDAKKRANEFVAIVPLASIDAWAYHGHGPNDAAERNAYRNIATQVEARAKVDASAGAKPFIETESGVSARTLVQQRMQARTAVQKLVWAQSQGVPLFFWFRTFISGGDGDYTNIKNAQEARPAVLSYRTMVRTLRGHSFEKVVDLGSPDYQGFLFVQKNDDGSRGKGRVLVSWATSRGGSRRLMSLGQGVNVRRVDLFGNVEPVTAAGKNTSTCGLAMEADPAFLAWDSSSEPSEVKVLASPLAVAPLLHLLPDGRESISVSIHNSSSSELAGSLQVLVPAGSAVAAPQSIPVRVASGAKMEIPISLQVRAASQPVLWPRRWSVFVDPPANFDLSTIRELPGQLSSNGKSLPARGANAGQGMVNLADVAGGFAEKREAILFATVDSSSAQTIRAGASADFWMEWFVNGQRVFSTLDEGNGGGNSIADHQFDVPLKKGRNLLAVRVLSGSQGWKISSGGPSELARLSGSAGSDQLSFELRGVGAGGKAGEVLASESARVEFASRLQAPPGAWDQAATWSQSAAVGGLGDAGVLNPFAIQPDASRWWNGPEDLSGRAWVAGDNKYLYASVEVRDDVHRPASGSPAANGDWSAGDGVRLAFESSGKVLDLALAGDGKLASIKIAGAWQALAGAGASFKVQRVDDPRARATWYFLRLDRALLPGSRLSFNAVALDDDWGVRKQRAPIADGFDAGLGVALDQRQPEGWPHLGQR